VALKILGISGSSRMGSYNTAFLEYALGILREKGVETSVFDHAAHPLPLFNEDLEREGFPEGAAALKQAIAEADGILFASPEYNASFSPLAKNIIDWASRPHVSGLNNVWANKPVVVISASPGGFGGFRSLVSIRPVFVQLEALILPQQVSLGGAHQAFNEDGTLKDARTAGFLTSALDRLVHVAGRLKD
jgi:NAD(P)H-dependent FMN reductase